MESYLNPRIWDKRRVAYDICSGVGGVFLMYATDNILQTSVVCRFLSAKKRKNCRFLLVEGVVTNSDPDVLVGYGFKKKIGRGLFTEGSRFGLDEKDEKFL